MRTNLRKNERGAALLETAITIPIILLIAVGIFEFGRAYQTWQVLTNAAREGARIAILVDKTDADVQTAVQELHAGGRPAASATAGVSDRPQRARWGPTPRSRITVDYPFQFIVLNPVVRTGDAEQHRPARR